MACSMATKKKYIYQAVVQDWHKSVDVVLRQDLVEQMALDFKDICQFSSPMRWTWDFSSLLPPRSSQNSNLNLTLKDILVPLVLLKVWMCSYNRAYNSTSWLTVTITAFEVGMFFLSKTFLHCNLKFVTGIGLFFYMVIHTSPKQVF